MRSLSDSCCFVVSPHEIVQAVLFVAALTAATTSPAITASAKFVAVIGLTKAVTPKAAIIPEFKHPAITNKLYFAAAPASLSATLPEAMSYLETEGEEMSRRAWDHG